MITDHENAQLTKDIIKVYKQKMSFMKEYSQRYGATNKREFCLIWQYKMKVFMLWLTTDLDKEIRII